MCLERPIYLPQQLSLGLLSERRGMGHAEVRYYLFRYCEPLRDFERVPCISQHKLFIWKSLQEAAGVDPQAGWSGASGNHQGRAISVNWVNGESAACICMMGGTRAQQRNNGFYGTSVWEKADPPAISLKLNCAVPFCMSLALFEQIPQC